MLTYEINILCDAPGCDERDPDRSAPFPCAGATSILTTEPLDLPDMREIIKAAQRAEWLVIISKNPEPEFICPRCQKTQNIKPNRP